MISREAHGESINLSDTEVLLRNLAPPDMTAVIIFFPVVKKAGYVNFVAGKNHLYAIDQPPTPAPGGLYYNGLKHREQEIELVFR